MTNKKENSQQKPAQEKKPVTIPPRIPEGLVFDHDPFQHDRKQTQNGRNG